MTGAAGSTGQFWTSISCSLVRLPGSGPGGMGAWDTSSAARTGSAMSAASLSGTAAAGGRPSCRLLTWRAVMAAWKSGCRLGSLLLPAETYSEMRFRSAPQDWVPVCAEPPSRAGSCCCCPPSVPAGALSCTPALSVISSGSACRLLPSMFPSSASPPLLRRCACCSSADRAVCWCVASSGVPPPLLGSD